MSLSSKEILSSEVRASVKSLLAQATATNGGGSSARSEPNSFEKRKKDAPPPAKTRILGPKFWGYSSKATNEKARYRGQR